MKMKNYLKATFLFGCYYFGLAFKAYRKNLRMCILFYCKI